MRRFSAVVTDEEYSRVQKLVRAGAAHSVAAEARKAVGQYLRSQTGNVWPDETAEELGLDYLLVLKVVQSPQAEGKVQEATAREETVLT